MARTLTPIDVHAFMNALVKQATGQSNISVYDTSTFISAGEKVLATGMENTINSLSIVLGRTMIEARPYNAKLGILTAQNNSIYETVTREISFYSKDAKAAGDWNTDLYTNLHMGYDNMENGSQSTKSMWEQNPPVALELSFGGMSVWQDSLTTYKYQLKQAFRSEAEFGEFISGVITEKMNDIAQQKEAYNRSILLNGIAATYNMNNPGSVINLTAAYNDRFGTNYSSADLRSTYLDSFLKFFVSTFKQTADRMSYRSAKYHWSPAKQIDGVNYTLLRHTSADKLRCILYNPLFIDAQAWVYPEIFNPSYLDLKTQYEGVDFWQVFTDDPETSAAINVTPAQTNKTSGLMEKGAAVNLPYVVGTLFDYKAMMTSFTMDDAETTPMEARKKFFTTWYSMNRQGTYNPTHNMVIFIMKDE